MVVVLIAVWLAIAVFAAALCMAASVEQELDEDPAHDFTLDA
jgi:hypothetical protein